MMDGGRKHVIHIILLNIVSCQNPKASHYHINMQSKDQSWKFKSGKWTQWSYFYLPSRCTQTSSIRNPSASNSLQLFQINLLSRKL